MPPPRTPAPHRSTGAISRTFTSPCPSNGSLNINDSQTSHPILTIGIFRALTDPGPVCRHASSIRHDIRRNRSRLALPSVQLGRRRHAGRDAGVQRPGHGFFHRPGRRADRRRLCRHLRGLRARQRALADPARSPGHVRARRHRADRPDHCGHGADDLCRGGHRFADAGLCFARRGSSDGPRLGGLCPFRRRSSVTRELAQCRLRDDRLAALRHSGRAGGEAALSAHRGIHFRFRRGACRDDHHLGAGAGDRCLSAGRARSGQPQEHQSAAPISISSAICRRPARACCAISSCWASAAS